MCVTVRAATDMCTGGGMFFPMCSRKGWWHRHVHGGGTVRILQCRLCHLRSIPVPCPSGRRCNSRKVVWVRGHRGFKSHRYRHEIHCYNSHLDLVGAPVPTFYGHTVQPGDLHGLFWGLSASRPTCLPQTVVPSIFVGSDRFERLEQCGLTDQQWSAFG